MIGPGVYYDMAAADYHADPCAEPSLSSSIANLLLTKTPAHARLAHPRLNPSFKAPSNAAMDLGSVAHEILLGKGAGFEISPFDDYRTKEARTWRDDALARGVIPIKAGDHDRAQQMADAVREKIVCTRDAVRAFWGGRVETVIVWRDADAVCRAMIDWLSEESFQVYDLKTTGTGLSDRALQSKIASGLDVQAAFYLRGLEHVMPDHAGRFAWRWVFVEDEEPFESRIIELDATTRALGDRKCSWAIETWKRCLWANDWPGYPRKIERLEYPAWAENAWLAREVAESEAG
jgi:hypothetical protein